MEVIGKPLLPSNNPEQSPEQSGIVVVNDTPPKRHLFGQPKVALGALTTLLTTAKGLTIALACSLVVIGGGSALVIKLTNTSPKAVPLPIATSATSNTNSTVPATGKPNGTSSSTAATAQPGATSTTSKAASNVSTINKINTTTSSSTTSSASSGSTTSSGTGSSSGGSSGGSGGPQTQTYSGCTYNGTVAPCIGSTVNGASGWGSPVFDDEFNASSVNTSIWNVTNGWTNQNGVTTYASNVSENGGNLVLNLASSSSGAEVETSSFTLPVGGFAEARVYFPGNGTTVYNWPAWWVSGPNWPKAGEADIFEGLGSATTNYHYYSNGNKQSGPFYISGTWTNNFHIFGLYRGSNYNDVYWDGTLVKTYSTYDDGQGETVILTLGSGNTPAYGSSSQVKVDYVRAWQ